MTDKFSFDEERFGRSIARAFERQPEPDLHRLDLIEARVMSALTRGVHKRTGPSWFGGLIFALVSVGAAAWWWGGYLARNSTTQDSPHAPALVSPQNQAVSPDNAPKQNDAIGSPQSKSSPRKKESSTVYRRDGL